MTDVDIKTLTTEFEMTGFIELTEDVIEFFENLRRQYEKTMQTIREAFNAMEEYADETEPSAEKPMPARFTDICLYVTGKCKSRHYFSMARGPPEILRA